MCKIYNPVGCLTVVKSHLDRHHITDFKSIKEVIVFQNSYEDLRRQIISNSERVIENEKGIIISEVERLKNNIESTTVSTKTILTGEIENLKLRLQELSIASIHSAWRKAVNYIRILFLKRKIRGYEISLPTRILQSVHDLTKAYQRNENRYVYITSQFQDAVIDNCSAELKELERKKRIIDEVSNSIYGAVGEQKVVKALEILSDEYVLINDFCLSFNPPIYNRNENDYIKSIQIDHLLIAPSGVFLIETKNWSEQSLNSLSLRSPVSQLKRTNFAVFKVLNKETEGLGLNQHHWGRKKIILKNLLVLINQKPQEEFQYVKILTLDQLVNYIKYFPPIYTKKETENMATELINMSKNEI